MLGILLICLLYKKIEIKSIDLLIKKRISIFPKMLNLD